jgi:hypothetical protein
MRLTQSSTAKVGVRLVVRWGLMACCLLGGKIDKHLALANAWPKDYIRVEREEVAAADWSDAKAPMTRMRRLRARMAKIGSGAVKVKFMELRPSMCRWPIGDPKHIETFRFCGSACSPGAIYCTAHNVKAHALQIVQGRHARPNFSYNPQVRVA